MISLSTYVTQLSMPTTDHENISSLEQRSLNKLTTHNPLLNFSDVDIPSDFLDALFKLSPSDNPKSHADMISRLLHDYKDPVSGKPMFTTLEQQSKVLQVLLEKMNTDPELTEALTIVLIGTTNLQSQMTVWMQDVIMSGGKSDEFEEW